ncbi:MAG: hypothetical protein PHT62_11755, partial [Desulfotomaculaceae bacterium]|nr:hypothetical protein [Desulfotomaculaceae bacterium]
MRKFIRPVRAKLLAAKKNTGGNRDAPGETPKDNTAQVKEAPLLSADLESNLARIKEIFQNWLQGIEPDSVLESGYIENCSRTIPGALSLRSTILRSRTDWRRGFWRAG